MATTPSWWPLFRCGLPRDPSMSFLVAPPRMSSSLRAIFSRSPGTENVLAGVPLQEWGRCSTRRWCSPKRNVFTMQSYHLLSAGRYSPRTPRISLERASGKYHVKTKARKDGREKVRDGTCARPAPRRLQRARSSPSKKTSPAGPATVHTAAFTPAPKLITLKLILGEQKVVIAEPKQPQPTTCSSRSSESG